MRKILIPAALTLLLPLAVHAATITERASAIIDALTDPVVKDAAQKLAITEDFCAFVGLDTLNAQFGTAYSDVTQFSSAQKSQVFVELMTRAGKAVLRKAREDETRSTADATVTAAGDAGEALLE